MPNRLWAQRQRRMEMPLSRREFLYYLWGASMALFMAGSAGAAIWFALPRFRRGEFGGVFTLSVDEIPPPDADPTPFAEARFWLANIGPRTLNDPRQPTQYPLTPGLKALYMVCVHLGCLYRWVPTSERFECLCHGSKYLRSGARIDGPARRNLDVFALEVLDPRGSVLARSEPSWDQSREGSAIDLPPGATTLRLDTLRLMRGAPNIKPGGGV